MFLLRIFYITWISIPWFRDSIQWIFYPGNIGCFDCTHKKMKHGFSTRNTKKAFLLGHPLPGFLGAFNAFVKRGRFSCEAGKHAKQSVIAGTTAISRRGDAGVHDTGQESRTPEIPWWFQWNCCHNAKKEKKHTCRCLFALGSPWFLLLLFFSFFLVFCWGLLIFFVRFSFRPV